MPRPSSFASLKASIDRLDPAEQQQLHQWLGKQLKARNPLAAPKNALSTRNYEGKTYVAQNRRCGKLNCDCMEGEISEVGHGPYWYVYWNQEGKTHSQYVGKRPPWQKDQPDKNREPSL